jgi:ketosteroid isomerase-like protein
LFSITLLDCQKPVDIAEEEQAIKELVKNIIMTFQNKDFDKYQNLWVHEPYVIRMGDDSLKWTGWDSLGVEYKTRMENNQNVRENLQVEIPEVQVKVYGDVAWVYNIHKMKWTNREGEPRERNTWNVRFLEKRDGQWKIALYVDGPAKKEY